MPTPMTHVRIFVTSLRICSAAQKAIYALKRCRSRGLGVPLVTAICGMLCSAQSCGEAPVTGEESPCQPLADRCGVSDLTTQCEASGLSSESRCLIDCLLQQLDPCATSTRCLTECTLTKYAQCDSGTPVPVTAICDGRVDCTDRSDEAYCRSLDCNDGTQVPERVVCDGVYDCSTFKDEEDCTFMCRSGREVIPKLWFCDDHVDCKDGSDEIESAACRHFVCEESPAIVIARARVCDSKNDCCTQPPCEQVTSDEDGCGRCLNAEGTAIVHAMDCDGEFKEFGE
jgi:low-density lipoprotein receptor class A